MTRTRLNRSLLAKVEDRLLAVLLVKSKSFGEYAIVGTSSTIVMLMYAVAVPPVLVAVIVNMTTCQQFCRRSTEHTVEVSKANRLALMD